MAKTETPALQQLKAWMAEDPKGRTQAFLARQLGVKPPSVYAWLEGQARPEPPLRKALQELTSIPEDDWWTPIDRAALDEARRRMAGDKIGAVPPADTDRPSDSDAA